MAFLRIVLLFFSVFLLIFMTGCSGGSGPAEEILSSNGVLASTDTGFGNTDILFQAFYWDCFNESGAGNWWETVATEIPDLSKAGVTAIWLPPAQKSNHSPSMGYDPYDYFDLGSFAQKGRTETYFGSRNELEGLINLAHQHGMEVYADLVYNHMSGGAPEENPITGNMTYTDFQPLSGEFQFNYNNFHPSNYSHEDEGSFGDFPDLDHDNPDTYQVLEKNILWLKNEIGFDGWRFDYVKGYSPGLIKALHDTAKGFAIGEYFDGDTEKIISWLSSAGSNANAFDFPLFFNLQQMCNTTNGAFNMDELWQGGVVFRRPLHSVTFAENHDTDKDNPIITDKMLAYAFIMTHEGIPTVFWRDYFNYRLGRIGEPNGIHRLMWVRKNLAVGSTDLLFSHEDAYVIQRDGEPGLLTGLNDHPDETKTVRVATRWKNQRMQLVAYNSSKTPVDTNDISTDDQGRITIKIPPRGYVIYGPGTFTFGNENI